MRKIYLIVISIMFLSCFKVFGEVKIAPYYYLYTSESGFITNTSSLALSTSIYGDFAARISFNEKWSMLALYELNYQGPGATSDSKNGANFQEQYQDHTIILKPSYVLDDKWTLGGRFGYALQLSKTGSSENWINGLYNYYGIVLGFEGKTKLGNNDIKAGYLFTQNLYPNYSNLLGYFDQTEAQPEQDHYRHKFYGDGTIAVSKTFLITYSVDDTIKTYLSQGIIEENGVENVAIAQLDNIAAGKINLSYSLLGGSIGLGLNQKVEFTNSNQNNLSYDPLNPTDTTTLKYMPNYYTYTYYEISPLFSFTFPNKIIYNLAYVWNIKSYNARPARDSKGAWLADLEYDIIRQISTGFSFPMGKFHLGLDYAYIDAVSNMGYEQYYMYNYASHNIKLSYSFEY